VIAAVAVAADAVGIVVPYGAANSPGIGCLPDSPVPGSSVDADYSSDRGLSLLAYQILL